MINTTLCYIEKDGKILMLNRNKKKNDLNEGKWIGVGGKFLENEKPEDCLIREVFEETGIILHSYEYIGLIHFRSDVEDEEMYLYKACYKGAWELKSCNEGCLEWIEKEKVLKLPIWEGDKYFLSKLFANESNIEMSLEYQKGKLIHVLDHNKTLSFTGHREFEEVKDELYSKTLLVIEQEYKKGINCFLDGGASGYDLICAKAVLALKAKYEDVKLILVLPFEDLPKNETGWDKNEAKFYYEALKKADDIIYVCDNSENRYHKRDRYLVDHSKKLLAFLRRPNTGTEYTVNYGREKGREIISI